MLAERYDDRIRVDADFDTKDRLLTLPGARYNKDEGVCELKLSYASCKQLRAILGDDLEIGDELFKWASDEVDRRIIPCLELRQKMEGEEVLAEDFYGWCKEVGFA